jgi:hypothetical protein
MLLHLVETQHGFIAEPHGEEPVAWVVDAVGGELMRGAGWRPYEMQRISKWLYWKLRSEGHLRIFGARCVHLP